MRLKSTAVVLAMIGCVWLPGCGQEAAVSQPVDPPASVSSAEQQPSRSAPKAERSIQRTVGEYHVVESEVVSGEVLEVSAEIVSTWDKAQKFKGFTSGCSCTKVRVEPSEWLPGEKAKVFLRFDSRGKNSSKFNVIGRTENSEALEFPVTFSFEVLPVLTAEHFGVDFGKIGGTPGTGEILFVSSEKITPESVSLDNAPVGITHSWSEKGTNEGRFNYALELSYSPVSEMRQLKSQCFLKLANFLGRDRLIPLELKADVLELVEVSPSRLFLGTVFETEKAAIEFRASSDKKLEIFEVSGPSWMNIRHEITKNADTSYQIRIFPTCDATQEFPLAGMTVIELHGLLDGKPLSHRISAMYAVVGK